MRCGNVWMLHSTVFKSIKLFAFCLLMSWNVPLIEMKISTVQFSLSVTSNCLLPHKLRHARIPCPSPTPGVYSNSCPLSGWCHSTISSSVVPFSSCLQSFPTSGSFPMSWLFASGSKSIVALVWSPCSPRDSQESSPTPQKHQFFGPSFLYGQTRTSIHDYWKNHSLD